jgi:Cu-processing system permease protein
MWPIAVNGFREARRNRVTTVAAGFALALLFSTSLVTQVTVWTFERVLTDFGLGMMSFLLSGLAIYLSCGLLPREIERRTIFLVVTRPVSRTKFLVARLCGNLLTLLVLELLMAAVFFLELKLYVVPVSQATVASLIGLYFELVVLSAAGFLFSSFSSQLVSALCTVGVYFAGHFAGDIYRLAERADPGVQGFTRFVYYLVPNLERVNFKTMAAYRLDVPWEQVASGCAYALAFAVAFTSLAALIFERRDFR